MRFPIPSLAPPARTSLVALLPLLATAACGGGESSESQSGGEPAGRADFPAELLPAELVPDLPLVAPESDLDVPVFSDIVDVAPGEDVTYCTFTDVVLGEATIFRQSFGAQSPQGHHSILQYTTTPLEPGTHPCGDADMGSTFLLGGTGGKGVADEQTYPPNFGVEVPAGAQLVINHHWLNTSDAAVRGQAMMLARELPRGGDTVLAGNMILFASGWEIPARGEKSHSVSCTYQEDVDYVNALGHMHEYGTHVSIEIERAAGGTEAVIDADWTADMATGASGQIIYSLDDPLRIKKGDTVHLTCDWANDTDEALGFPREMCLFFGNTIGQNYFCFNDTWMTSGAAQGAGSQEVINAL